EGLRFADEVEAARRAVRELHAHGAQVVILLSHSGQEYYKKQEGGAGGDVYVGDETIARETPGIDLIVGGHLHVPLYTPLRVGSTLIVNTGCYLERAGEAELDYDTAARKVVSSTGSLTELYVDKTGQDPAVKKVVDRWYDQVGRALSVVVATTTADLRRDDSTDSPMGDWITDCMRHWSKTDLAVINAHGIRADIPPGPVRLRELFEVAPFDDYLSTVYIKGADLRKVLEFSVSGAAAGLLQLSGATVSYDPKAPVGSRVRDVVVEGRPLEPDAEYSVVAPDFVLQGGSGYTAFSASTDEADQGLLIRDVLGWCARREGVISAPAGGRMKPL
ncbi:MAG: bifunctional metallophosphatase/5'-nucleotidase, partial [Elusimicrobia bacterium]|nr:bifunctional metallophosphatase/5'-nucleotidase [Elusimicrobiota bacterium]